MLQVLINGLTVGGMFGLMAVAYSVVYGVLGMVNFAFGEMFMFGAFGAVLASASKAQIGGHDIGMPGLPLWASAVVGILIGGTVGLLVERLAYRPLRSAPVLTLLIASLAASLLLKAVATYLFGAGQTPVSAPDLGTSRRILGAHVQRMDLLIFVVACVVMAVFASVVRYTAIGRAIRATAQDQEAAQLMGVGVERVIMTTFLLGSCMAAIAGVLYSWKFQFAAATMGFVPGLMALVAAVLGGIGNVPGAFVGGLVLGVVESFGAAYLPQGSAYQDVIAFSVLVAILWLRPQGLFGQPEAKKV